jgi:hypothetical protein
MTYTERRIVLAYARCRRRATDNRFVVDVIPSGRNFTWLASARVGDRTYCRAHTVKQNTDGSWSERPDGSRWGVRVPIVGDIERVLAQWLESVERDLDTYLAHQKLELAAMERGPT